MSHYQSSKDKSGQPRHSSTSVDAASVSSAETPRTTRINNTAIFPRTQPTELSSLEAKIVRDVPLDDYPEFTRFIIRNISILNTFRESAFVAEIRAALAKDDEDQAEKYAEKLVLLTECKNNYASNDTLSAYLSKLNKKERRYMTHLDSAIQKVVDRCKRPNVGSRRDAGGEATSTKSSKTLVEPEKKHRHEGDLPDHVTHGVKSLSISPTHAAQNDMIYSKSPPHNYAVVPGVQNRHAATSPPKISEPWLDKSRQRAQQQLPPVSGSWDRRNGERAFNRGDKYEGAVPNSTHQYGTGTGNHGRHRDDNAPPPSRGGRPRSSTGNSGRHPRSSSEADSDLSRTVTIQGNATTRNAMESRESIADKLGLGGFQVHLSVAAKRFYTKYRVFAIYTYTENASTARKAGMEEHLTYNQQLGVYIRSHKQRYIVVEENRGYCLCIPINTYSGQGLLKPGLRDAQIRAHAVAYTGQVPETLKVRRRDGKGFIDEPEMTKKPIEIAPASPSPDCLLNAASRINFGEPTTIQHNVRSFNIGVVAKDSRPYFLTYWKQHAKEWH